MKFSISMIVDGFIIQTLTGMPKPISSGSPSSHFLNPTLRGSPIQRRLQSLKNVECTLFRRETRHVRTMHNDSQGSLVTEEETWSCELDHDCTKAIGLNGIIPITVDLDEAYHEFFETQGAKSGLSTLRASDVLIQLTNGTILMEIPSTSSIQVLDSGANLQNENVTRHTWNRRNLVASTGTLKTLVVRVIAKNGVGPNSDINQLRSDIFEDRVCLKSQYEVCSFGQLIIEPFNGLTETGKTVKGGVVEVRVDVNPIEGNRGVFEWKAMEATTKQYGTLSPQFDLVLFSIPPGTGDWIAYAYINRFDSYFNNEWSSSISTQVHEVGHCLNLGHSGEGSETYGDQTGMMGFSYNFDDAPKMCFNPAKNYQLGWYRKQEDVVDPLMDILAKDWNNKNSRDYVLNGVNDFQFGENSSEQKLITLFLTQANSREGYYVGFNRKAGINSGTPEDGNSVTIVQKDGDPFTYGQSWKVATLSNPGDAYTIQNFDGSSFDVNVKLVSIVGKDAKVRLTVTNSLPCDKVKDSDLLNYRHKQKRNCKWVSKRKYRRCSKTWDFKLLSEWCPRSCGSCP